MNNRYTPYGPMNTPIGNMQQFQQNFQQQFLQFRQSVQGDPRQIIQQNLQRGQISQSQVDAAFQMARNMGLIR